MADQENSESQNLKDRAWTTDEIRKHSSNWTLAGDVGLFNLLNEFSHQIISRTHEVENAVDSLVHQTKMTTAKINNVINDFHMLSNLQFVENRVYDEDAHESVTENKQVVEKTKEQREAEMLPKIIHAVELGLAVLDTAFDRINVNEISDSEDEEDISSEGRTILEPKDPYEHRPLPYIIGSDEFMKCDFAGLKDLVEDDIQSYSEESSISETDETSSDEEEPLPLDDKFSDRQIDDLSQNISDRLSSDESELFGSEKDVNGFGSESSFEVKAKEKSIEKSSVDTVSQKTARQNSVSSIQSKLKLPQVLPVPKLHENKEEDDLFAGEDPSDDESPFRKKTGLFTSDIKFSDEKDDDLFGGSLFAKDASNVERETKPAEVPKISPKKPQNISGLEKKKPALFDNDEDSEDDIFNTLMKTKAPAISKSNQSGSQDSSEKADSLSTPSSAPSIKPTNAFDFGVGGGNGDSLFGDDSDGDDLFSNKKILGKKTEFSSSGNDDLFSNMNFKSTKDVKQPEKKESGKPSLVKKVTKDSLFEDSDTSEEKLSPVKPSLPSAVLKKKEKSLFDDDDDLEDDIFSSVSKEKGFLKTEVKSSLFEESVEVSKETKPKKPEEKPSLFEDSIKVSKETKPKKPEEKPSLFEDSIKVSKETKPKKPEEKPSLFEDSIKVSKETKPKKPEEKPSLFEDSIKVSKETKPKKPEEKPSLFEDSIKVSKETKPKKPEEKPSLFEDSIKVSKETKPKKPEEKPSLFEDSIKVSKETKPKKPEEKPSLFEDSIKVSKETKPKKPEEKPSLFEDSIKVSKETKPKKPEEKPSLFEDSIKVSKETKPKKPEEKPSLFEDSIKVSKETKPKKPEEKPSLFEDSIKISKEPKPPKIKEKLQSSLFDNSTEIVPKETKIEKPVEKAKAVSLFDDSEEDSSTSLPVKPNIQQKKLPSLFDDSDNLDLFASKTDVKQSEPKVVETTKPVSIPSPSKEETIDSNASFDVPADSSNVLNVINKSRVKMPSKRRKPTRQGRLAALETSSKEEEPKSETPSEKSDLNTLSEGTNDLFSAEKPELPKVDHKTQEKKKMNLMSQLASEISSSKIALKRAAVKEDEEEDEVDIFSEAARKDRSKGSFSFRPPLESGIASVFPIDKDVDKKEEPSDVAKSDSFEDDFFTEPAFQNFKSSISHKESILDEEDDDDDLFSAIKSNTLPKLKTESPETNDLFGDDTDDIFASAQKEKYEMFPNQVFDDEDDDIFSNVNTTAAKSSNKTNNSSTVKKVETQQVNAFDDPLTGLLGEE